MKLAVVGHHVAPIAPPFAGGVESLTWYLCRWLADRGHEVVLFAVPGSAVPGVEVRELELDLELSAAALADVSMGPPAFIAAHHAYLRLMLELAAAPDEFDVVNSHSLHYLPVAMAAAVPTPMVLTLHTPPTPWLQSALAAADRRSPRLSAVSEQTVRAWAPVRTIADVVPNGVDARAWPLGPGGSSAAWSGRMVAEKAPHLAIDAARRAGLTLHLAGPISDLAYWEREVAPRLGDDVHYVGHLNHRELAALLGSSCVALMSSVWEEPFGLAAAEAMCTGTPVAAFASGALRDLVTPRTGALARVGDTDALAQAIAAARRLPRRAVRAEAQARFGLDAMGESYERLYARILDGDARALQAA